MNLLQMTAGAIGIVNPSQPATLVRSKGYTIVQSGRQTPAYESPVPIRAQVQDLTQRDIQHLNSLNIQGSQKTIFFSGEVSAISRVAQKGGDIIGLLDGRVWLTTAVLEQWPDWCHVAVTQQTDLGLPFFPSLRFNDARNSQYVPLAF